MPSYLHPGVYVEEVPSGVRTIVGVSTSVAAFVDYFPRGPLDRAVQVFNEGDFEREFGGLHLHSEASYAVRQFFQNGGSTAWIVRTAKAGTARAAKVVLQDGNSNDILEAKAGRRIRDESVDDPGEWGNNLLIDIDYQTADPATQFNLTVSEIDSSGGSPLVLRSETHRNLSMDINATNDAVAVVNDASKMIQLTRKSSSTSTTRPAPTARSC